MSPTSPTLAAAVAAALLASTAPVMAQEDRFTLRLSGFHTDSRLELGTDGRARVDDFPFQVAFDSRDRVRGSRTRPHLQAMWRLDERHRLLAAHYETRQGRRYPFDSTVSAEGFADGELRLWGDAGFDIEFELANLMYEYAVFSTRQWTVGLAGGLHWARLEAWADVTATAEYDGESRTETLEYDWVRRRWAPSLGLRVAYQPRESWLLSMDAQGFSTSWGNFTSERGHYVRMGFNAEYRLTRNLGVHAGYDWFRLKISDGFRGGLVDDAVRYRGQARAELDVRGPTLGVTFAF